MLVMDASIVVELSLDRIGERASALFEPIGECLRLLAH